MQRTEAEIEASRARRRQYMRLYMVAYRQTERGRETTKKARERWLLKRAAELQAREHDGSKAVT